MKKSILTIMAAMAIVPAMAETVTINVVPQAPVQSAPIRADLGAQYNFSTPFTVADAPVAQAGVPSLDFHYCGNPEGACRAGYGIEDMETSAAILLPAALTESFAGTQITSVWICSGINGNTSVNHVTDATVFISNDIFGGEPKFTQRAKLSRSARTYNEVKLSKPYTIKGGETLFIGFTVVRPTDMDFTFVYDLIPSEHGNSFWVNYEENGERQWADWSTQYGSLCMRLTIEGDNLPQHDVEVSRLNHPFQVVPGKRFNNSFTVTNHGVDPLTSATFEVKVGDEAPMRGRLSLPNPLQYNESAQLEISTVCNTLGSSVPLTVTCVQANDADDTYPDDNTVSGSLLCLADGAGYMRSLLFEEGTGTWCGWCPRGTIAMNYMNKRHKDSFIGIAVHRNDPMQISTPGTSTADFEHGYAGQFAVVSSYPHARYNRIDSYGFTISGNSDVERIHDEITALPAVAAIDFDIYFSSEAKDSLTIESNSRFVLDNDTEYRVNFVLLEDNVGPYQQANNLSGMSGDYDGWERLDGQPSVYFDHVARYSEAYHGVEGSLPIKKKGGVSYPFNIRIPLTQYLSNDDLDKFSVVAMIINNQTREVENAVARRGSSNLEVRAFTSIESVSEAPVSGLPAWYTIQGVRIDEPSAPGIYIRVVNGKSTKVIL